MSGKLIIDSALRAAVNLQSSRLPTAVAKSSGVLLSSLSGKKHVLPDLPYDYNALERKWARTEVTMHTGRVIGRKN
jgi:superoxide dismutase, Fe-Mn family